MRFDETEVREEFSKKRAEGIIPEATIKTLELYVWEGMPTGGFLRAFLANDLRAAIAKADAENYAALREIAQLVHRGLPSLSHGSYEKVNNWLSEMAASKRAQAKPDHEDEEPLRWIQERLIKKLD